MLLTITPPAPTLTPTVDPLIEQLVNLIPDFSGGDRTHSLYVNKMRGQLPGNYSQLFGPGPSFRSIFFAAWQPDPLLGLVADTGLDDGWWSNLSVAVLCQAIAELGSDIRGQMLGDKINGEVGAGNTQLRQRSARVYARVLAATYEPLMALLRQVNPATAKAQFRQSLLDNVLSRQLWFQAGMWTSPDWEMFNQYAKYIVLGASDAEVDALIGDLKAAGLPVPAVVDQGAWLLYAEEFRRTPSIDVNDIRSECAGPIAAETELPNFGGGFTTVRMPNGNCYEFTAGSQPGNIYRGVPAASGSCFTGETQVLDGDGEPVALRDVKPGDTVLTRNGTATVAFVSRPLRAGRALYRLEDGGPVFTETHPFMNGELPDPSASNPAVLALDPTRLAAAVPTLSEDGIGALRAGSTVLGRPPGRNSLPVPTPVTRVDAVPDGGDDPFLYDLNLVTESGGRQEYFAGQGGTFYLVTPEFPILGEAGAAATMVVRIMEGLLADPAEWPRGIIETVSQFGAGVFHSALMTALAATPSFGEPVPPESIYERIARLYGGLATAPAEMAAIVASVFDGLMSAIGQWMTSLVAVGWRMSEQLQGDVLAVTVFDMALTPSNPVPASTPIRLDVDIAASGVSVRTPMWDRRGRANTRFHRYFDQIFHVDLSVEEHPDRLSFAAMIDGAPIPAMFAEVPPVIDGTPHQLLSAPVWNPAGAVVGSIRYDMRRLSREAASQELGNSGLWTDDAANAYANALGGVMADTILKRLRELAPTNT